MLFRGSVTFLFVWLSRKMSRLTWTPSQTSLAGPWPATGWWKHPAVASHSASLHSGKPSSAARWSPKPDRRRRWRNGRIWFVFRKKSLALFPRMKWLFFIPFNLQGLTSMFPPTLASSGGRGLSRSFRSPLRFGLRAFAWEQKMSSWESNCTFSICNDKTLSWNTMYNINNVWYYWYCTPPQPVGTVHLLKWFQSASKYK